jgi:P27 family predicted phage terminase small subunit
MWQAVVPSLVATGVATEFDSAELTVMCEWWRQYRKIQKAINKVGATNPAYYKLMIQMNMASNNFDKLAAKFGMTPADRTRVRVEKPKQEEKETVGARSRA